MLAASAPLLYLITDGLTNAGTTPNSRAFARLLSLIETAVALGLDLVQIREKDLTARTLFELACRAAALTRGSATRLLINERADLARAAGADGAHLTTTSLNTEIVRRTFGPEFLIGVSTHSLAEARAAQTGGADFIVFGPVFATPSKHVYGPPAGVEKLAEVVCAVNPLPVLALGGITLANAPQVLTTGAAGWAGIGLFNDPNRLSATVDRLTGFGRKAAL